MASLGIYFGPKTIAIVDSKGKQILSNLKIPRSVLAGEQEDKVPEEVKIVALLKDELRKNRIDAREAIITLSGKDLIIRGYEMPVLPRDELQNAVNFEAKRYIPFKVEELVSDYQLELDKSSKRNVVLFAGIKKDVLDKYLSIFSQLNIKVLAIEYAAFSLLRLLKLCGISDKGVVGVVSVDIREEDEVNFTVMEKGFPLFSRDITLFPENETQLKPVANDSAAALEKLKTEIRVSLDYYNRKFPAKTINKIIFVCGEAKSDLELFVKELGLAAQFVEVEKHLGKAVVFSLSSLKAYSASLVKTIKTSLKIDLIAAKSKVKSAKEKERESVEIQQEVTSIFSGISIDLRFVFLALLVLGATYGYGIYRKIPVQNDIGQIIGSRLALSTVKPDATLEQLREIDAAYKEKITTLTNLINKQLMLTEPLNIIPEVLPEGMWLTAFSFRKEETTGVELTLRGVCFQAEGAKEIQLINSFVSILKNNAKFSNYFKEIDLLSTDNSQILDSTVTNFVISCRDKER